MAWSCLGLMNLLLLHLLLQLIQLGLLSRDKYPQLFQIFHRSTKLRYHATKMNHKQNVMELTQVWMPAGLTCTVFLSQPVDQMTSENTRVNHHRITQV